MKCQYDQDNFSQVLHVQNVVYIGNPLEREKKKLNNRVSSSTPFTGRYIESSHPSLVGPKKKNTGQLVTLRLSFYSAYTSRSHLASALSDGKGESFCKAKASSWYIHTYRTRCVHGTFAIVMFPSPRPTIRVLFYKIIRCCRIYLLLTCGCCYCCCCDAVVRECILYCFYFPFSPLRVTFAFSA